MLDLVHSKHSLFPLYSVLNPSLVSLVSCIQRQSAWCERQSRGGRRESLPATSSTYHWDSSSVRRREQACCIWRILRLASSVPCTPLFLADKKANCISPRTIFNRSPKKAQLLFEYAVQAQTGPRPWHGDLYVLNLLSDLPHMLEEITVLIHRIVKSAAVISRLSTTPAFLY